MNNVVAVFRRVMRYTLIGTVVVAAGYLVFAYPAVEKLARAGLLVAGIEP